MTDDSCCGCDARRSENELEHHGTRPRWNTSMMNRRVLLLAGCGQLRWTSSGISRGATRPLVGTGLGMFGTMTSHPHPHWHTSLPTLCARRLSLELAPQMLCWPQASDRHGLRSKGQSHWLCGTLRDTFTQASMDGVCRKHCLPPRAVTWTWSSSARWQARPSHRLATMDL